MLIYKGKVMRQYSFADLKEIKALLQDKHIEAIDKAVFCCVLPNKTHFLSMLMSDQNLQVKILRRLVTMFKDEDTE